MKTLFIIAVRIFDGRSLARWPGRAEKPLFCLCVLLAGLLLFSPALAWGQGRYAGRMVREQGGASMRLASLEHPPALSQPFSLYLSDVTLEQALRRIGARAGINIVYAGYDVLSEERVTLHPGEARTVHGALQAVLRGTDLALVHSRSGRFVLVRQPPENKLKMAALDLAKLPVQVPTTVETAEMQLGTITGVVTDSTTGNPLPGVNVIIAGTQRGAATDAEGRFTISNLEPGTYALLASFIGYDTKRIEGIEVVADETTTVNIALQSTQVGLEEVVVVGYGTQAVETTTGAVSQITGEELDVNPVTNLTNTLAGSIPGIIGVNDSGEPGYNGSNILIRGAATLGNNSPLVVIDGVPAREGGLARLNPSAIKSVSVLKDASAAIYGSRAANGVILVTTKQGRVGPPRINVTVDAGLSSPTVLPDMAGAATYMTMLNEIDTYRENPPRFTQEEIKKHRNPPEDSWKYFNTDWYAATFKPFAQQLETNVSVSGGTERIRYFIAGRALTENGIYENSATRYNQYGFRTNLDGNISENITLHLRLHGWLEDRNFPTVSAGGIFWMLQRGKPTEPAYWPNGKPGPDIEYGHNPVVAATPATGYDDDERYFMQSNLGIDIAIPAVEGLTLEADAAYDVRFRNRELWQTPWTLYYWDYQTYDEQGNPILTPTEVGYPEPRLTRWSENEQDVMLRGTATYENSIGDHNFSLLAGTAFQSSDESWMGAFRRFYATDELPVLDVGGTAERNNWGTGVHSARLSYFGRLTYDYKEKYLFQFVGRYDGSYIFAEDSRFAFFPAFSVGWRLSEEEWFSDAVGFFDQLKLRASWGQTGNDRIEPYQYLLTYGFGTGYVLGGEVVNGLSQTRVPNRDITWEVANQFDVGVDATVLDGRLSITADYFRYLRTEILWWRGASIPATAGFNLPRENIGKVVSYGFDGIVSYRQPLTQDWSLTLGANMTYATNEIKYWAEAPGAPPWQRSTGRPMDSGLYYIAKGVFNTWEDVKSHPHWANARPGDLRFVDYNDDGKINGKDRVRIEENEIPDVMFGFSLSTSFHQFSAMVQFQGAAQARQYVFGTHGEFGNYFQKYAQWRWNTDHKQREHPRAFERTNPYWTSQANTYFLKNAKYLRLETARITYTLPPNFSGQYGFEMVQIYLSGNNLLTWSPMDIMDPESRTTGANYYPQMKTYNLGLSVTF